MKILYGAAAVSTMIAMAFAIWWAYVTAQADDKHKVIAFILAFSVCSFAVLFVILSVKVMRVLSEHRGSPSTPDNHTAALRAAEQRIADLEHRLDEKQASKESALPTLRPKIVPVRWGRTPDNRCGLFIRNDGEPTAFDISVEEPVLIGKSKLQFWERVHPGLTKADGEILMEANIEVSTGYGLTADALRDEMIKADLDAITLKTKYGDMDGQKWITSCDVVCEVWGTGMRISGVRQERVA